MLQVTWIHHWSRLSKQRSIGVQPKGSGLILWILCQKQSLTICFLQTSEHQLRLQQEQFQTQELSRTLSQQLGMEGDIQLASSWSVDEVGPFVRNLLQAQSVGLNDSDLHRKRLSSFEEQFSNLKRNLALQEQQQQGTFEPNPTAFAWPALSALASGMEGENVNSLDQSDLLYMHSNNRLGPFSSGNHSLGRQILGDVYTSHPDLIESYRSRQNGQLENSWAGKQMQQLSLESYLQRRESAVDSSTWTSAEGIHENSKNALMDDLQQKLGIQSMQSSEVDEQYSTSPSEQQASNLPFNHLTDQEVNVNISFSEVPQNSGSFAEQSLILGSGDPFSSRYAGARLTAKFSVDKELLEGKEKKNGLKSMISRSGSVSGSEDNILEQVETTLNSGDLQSRTHLRHGSLSTGYCQLCQKGVIKFHRFHHPRVFSLIKTRCHS